MRPKLAKRLATTFRVMHDSSLLPDVEASLLDREWSPAERSEFASGLRKVLMYADLDPEANQRAAFLHRQLVGEAIEDQVTILLRTPYWDLHESRETIHGTPPRLADLADRLAQESADLGVALMHVEGADSQTRHVFLREVARRVDPRRLGERALEEKDWGALAAALSTADELGAEAWATETLALVARSAPARVPELVVSLEPNPERIDLALDVIRRGEVDGTALANLVLGARIRLLDTPRAAAVIRAVAEARGIEPALEMLVQWLETDNEQAEEIRGLAGEIALRAMNLDQPMVEFELVRLAKSGALSDETIRELLRERFTNHKGLVDELDTELLELSLRQPYAASEILYDVARRPSGFALFDAGTFGFLSRLAGSVSPDAVWAELEAWDENDLRWAIHHLKWTGNEPDPLVRLFLTSNRLDDLADEAAICFHNTLGVVRGPIYEGLEPELDRARAWASTLATTPARDWTKRLVEGYIAEIGWQRRRDEENLLY